jgi:phosphoribosylanthranilate isomerase
MSISRRVLKTKQKRSVVQKENVVQLHGPIMIPWFSAVRQARKHGITSAIGMKSEAVGADVVHEKPIKTVVFQCTQEVGHRKLPESLYLYKIILSYIDIVYYQ